MRWALLALAAALTGCANVSDLEQSHESMSVISGKEPDAYAKCLVDKLADSRDPSVIESQKDGVRVIVPQKLLSSPAALVDITERSGGSSIKVRERMSNMPLRVGDVQAAATECISG
ncbi:hypothetical protein [Pseudomonas sp. R5(2019)]|uniref:hypothetical protein n=1 Tax=Pseudomonas sp. R5(2019) TaxID=2697566 RepID=UPI0014123BAF|nr:hypothetical protein [Pseudomonas sp. R5(2019)]NBA97417.1 hypothetical protein [Pseudomonas sp. R5(2019)]